MRKIGTVIGLALSMIVGAIVTPLALIYFACRPRAMTMLSDPEQARK